MSGQAGEGDPARFQMDEEQDVVGGETSPGKHLNGEEIGTCQDGEVGSDEIAPGGSLAAFRCRRDPVPAKDVAHGLIGNSVAEIGQSSDDAVVSPARVLSCEADEVELDPKAVHDGHDPPLEKAIAVRPAGPSSGTAGSMPERQ